MDEEREKLLKAANHKLSVAEMLLSEGEDADAVSRAYYGMFHAARAALLLEDSRPKTHAGVASELGKLFRERIDPDLLSAFAQIQTMREDADYEPYFDIERDRAHEVVDTAEAFVNRVEELV